MPVSSIASFPVTSPKLEVSSSEQDMAEAREKVRQEFLNHYEDNKHLYDASDVQLLTEDWYIERFLVVQNFHVENTVTIIKDCLRWRKDIDLSRISETTFPREFYETGGIFEFGMDREGVPVLYLRVRKLRRLPELDESVKQFLAFYVNKVDSKANKLFGWSMVIDCSHMGLANVHLDTLWFLVTLLKDYFPFGAHRVVVYEMPWIVNSIQKMVFAVLSAEAKQYIHFKTKKDIRDVISDDNLPDFMGGSNATPYSMAPSGCGSIEVLSSDKFKLEPQQLEKVKKHFDKHLLK